MWLKNIILLILAILSSSHGSSGKLDNGYTIPSGDINLEYGKSVINVTCVITNTTMIKERLKNPNTNDFVFMWGKNVRVPESQIKRINETAIMYINENPDVMDQFLNCNYKNTGVGLNSITVGTKPNNVTDFKCTGYNLENFTCSWTPDQKSKFHVNYTLIIQYVKDTPNYSQCSPYKDGNGTVSCFWNILKTPFYRSSHDKIYFKLISENRLGINNQSFEIDHYKKIKTSPPSNLRVENTTVSSLFLTWEIPDTMVASHVFLEHKITYMVEGFTDFKVAKYITTNCLSKQVFTNLTDLPFANIFYDVRVHMRLNNTKHDSNWSGSAFVVMKTNATLPGAPIANIRGFYNSNGGVVIYWKQVDPYCRNGANFTYVIENKTTTSEWIHETIEGYVELRNLNTSHEHTFEIRSKNNMGISHNYSKIIIPQLDNPEMTMEFPILKEYSETTKELSWSKPITGNENLVDYTVYWCESSKVSSSHFCSNISWVTVPKNITSYNITISENNNIEMAISANGVRESTSMKWPDCKVRHGTPLHKSSIEVNHSNISATSVDISWKIRCFMDAKKRIKNYVIEYCITENTSKICKGEKVNQTISIDSESSIHKSYTLKDLEPYATYRVNMLIEDLTGSYISSGEIFITTLEGTPFTPTDLHITETTNTSINVEWSLPNKHNSQVIRSFTVKCNDKTFDVKRDIGAPQKQSFSISNLTSYETYSISIKACFEINCSNYSSSVIGKTKIGRPSRIDKISYYSLNNSISWRKPASPGGYLNYYEIEQTLDKREKLIDKINLTSHSLKKCGENSPYKMVSYKVRAVNIDENNEIYAGDWSDEDKQMCQKTKDYSITVYIIIGCVIFSVIMVGILSFGKRCYIYFITMKDVQFQLPDGLYDNKDRFPRGNELDFKPQGDDQFLLYDKDIIKRSGDSSGCSSGQDSAESDSGTSLGSSTDSGTEQPRTKDDRLVEAVPLDDFSLSTSGNGPTTYCQLGYPSSHSDSKEMTPFSFPKVDLPLIRGNEPTSGSDNSPYIRCDQMPQMIETRPITAGYVANPIPPSSGYVPHHAVDEKKTGYVPHPSVDKNTGYVMAADKNSVIQSPGENKSYVQVADVSNSQMLNNDLPRSNGYVSYGDVKSLPTSPEMKGTSAYVPHKQLDEVLNK